MNNNGLGKGLTNIGVLMFVAFLVWKTNNLWWVLLAIILMV